MIAMRALLARGQLDIKPRDMPLLDALHFFEPSWISLVPTQLHRLLNAPGGGEALAKCDGVLLGGGPSSLRVRRDALERGIALMVSYGTTETAAMVTSSRDATHVLHATCAGETNPRSVVECTEGGEILVAGDGLALGAIAEGALVDICQPPRSEKERAQGAARYATGDLGRMENGVLFVEGRKDRMFISGGENIHPEAIERALLEHPHVGACVVVDVSSEEFGARPLAIVAASDAEITADALASFLRDRLPGFLVPDAFYAAPDSMRRNRKLSPARAKALLHREPSRQTLRRL